MPLHDCRIVEIGPVSIGPGRPLALIAGCCAIESRERALRIAETLQALTRALDMPFIFKASYDKANRNSIGSYRGPGMDEGLAILAEIRQRFQVPVLTDVHREEHVAAVAQAVDVLQIPAFLVRQTDLVVAAAETGKVINLKKGQFMAPWDMANIIGKVTSTGNHRILSTERGVSFGYNRLVSDMTALPTMRALGYPVVFDATHSVQTPAGQGGSSGGDRTMIPTLARAACAAGTDALFMEVHDDPDHALCDGPNSMPLDAVEALLRTCQAISRLVADAPPDHHDPAERRPPNHDA